MKDVFPINSKPYQAEYTSRWDVFIASLSARTQSKSYAIARRQVQKYVKHTFVIENIGVLSYNTLYDLNQE